MAENWIPDSCSLTPPEQSQRLIEFDDLLGSATSRARLSAEVIRFTLRPERESEARELAERETQCCSFFDFEFHLGPPMEMTIIVPSDHSTVLDAIEQRLDQNQCSS